MRAWTRRTTAAAVLLVTAALAVDRAAGAGVPQNDWTIPPNAAGISSPIEVTPETLKRGTAIFESRCRLCHGPEGKGNGPLSDPAHPAADLTAGLRADLPPDGVLFYRIWNGKRPMPAFKSELTREEVWAVVAFVKTLRPE